MESGQFLAACYMLFQILSSLLGYVAHEKVKCGLSSSGRCNLINIAARTWQEQTQVKPHLTRQPLNNCQEQMDSLRIFTL